MKTHLMIHLDEEDNGRIGKVNVGLYNDLNVDIGLRATVFMTYEQALQLLDNLTEGLSKVPEAVKHTTEKERRELFLKTEGWIS